MTTLAACRVGSTYALAADRRISFGNEFANLDRPKIRMVTPWLALGAVGGSDGAAWVRSLTVTAEPATQGEAQVALDAIGETFRSWAKERGNDGASMLGITPWGIVNLHTCGSADFLTAQIFGQGSGGTYAMGAMHGIRTFGKTLFADVVAIYGVETAALYDSGTGGPIDVLTIEAAP